MHSPGEYIEQSSNIAVYIVVLSFFLGDVGVSSCSHKLAFYRICFEIGEMCYFRTDLRTYYGDTYLISQEKNNLGLTISIYDGTIGVPPPGYIHM